MNYVMWRLHRDQVYLAGIALAAIAILLVTTGVGGIRGDPDTSVADLIDISVFIPLLLGLFWGAPLLSTEFESGTHTLAWTQGVTRRRWFSTSVGWPLALSAFWSGLLTVLVTWWQYEHGFTSSRFETVISFDIQGIVPVAYSVFAVALGIAAGVLFKRVVPAMAITLAVFVALRVVIQRYVRPHYMNPHSVLISLATSRVAPPSGTWTVANKTTRLGYLYRYQPASRFWAFQGIEAGIFILLAIAVIAVAYRHVSTHDA